MTTIIHCPNCAKSYTVSDETIGKTVVCKACQERFQAIDFGNETAGQSIIVSDKPTEVENNNEGTRLARRQEQIESAMIPVGIVSLIGFWVMTVASPRGPAVILEYGLLFGGVWLIIKPLVQFMPANWVYKKSHILGPVAAMILWGYFDTYEHPRPLSEGGEVTDTIHRFTHAIVKRSYVSKDGMVWWGPMKGEPPKQHGHWINYFRGQSEDEWFWYGEKITQGEWELRNKR